eukprot:8711258-Heterocapsa_arctica.AAC.1
MVLVGAVPGHGAGGLREGAVAVRNPSGHSGPRAGSCSGCGNGLFRSQFEWAGRRSVRTSGGTDNQGNAHVVEIFRSTRFPLCAVLIELSLQRRALLVAVAGVAAARRKYRGR